MPNFWSSAQEGFNRGVGFGSEVYLRAREEARLAREAARDARVQQKRLALQERAQKLSEQIAKQRAVEHSLRVAREKQEIQLAKDARTAQKAAVRSALPEGLDEAFEQTYGVPLPADVDTMGELQALGYTPAEVLDAAALLRRKRTPTVSHSYSHRDRNEEDPIRGGQVEAVREYDALLSDLEGRFEAVPEDQRGWGEGEALRTEIDKVRARRTSALQGMGAREYEAYQRQQREASAPVDASGPGGAFLPGITPMGGSSRLQGLIDGLRGAAVGRAAQPLTAHPVQQSPAMPGQEDDPYDFLDDIDLGL